MIQKEPMEQELWKVVRRRAIVGAVLIFLGVFVVQVVSYMITWMIFSVGFLISGQEIVGSEIFLGDHEKRQIFVESYSLIISVIYIVWCGVLYRKSQWRQKVDYRKAFQKERILEMVLIGCCGCFFSIVVVTVLQNIFPAFFQEYEESMENFNTGTWTMFLYAIVLGPVAEELIFRGVLFDRLYLVLPFWAANLLQALLFGIYHGNVIQGVYAFGFGLLLGVIHFTGESLWNNIFTHMLFNTTNFVVPVVYEAVMEVNAGLVFGVVLLGFAGFLLGLIRLKRSYWQKQHMVS